MFHSALQTGYFDSHNKTNRRTYLRRVCHLLFVHQHISIGVYNVEDIIHNASIKNGTNYNEMLLTPRSRAPPEKLTGPQLVKKPSAFYGTRKGHYRIQKSLPTVFILSQINQVHSSPIPLLEDPFLSLLAKLRKVTISFVMSVCPSVRPPARPEQFYSQQADFHGI